MRGEEGRGKERGEGWEERKGGREEERGEGREGRGGRRGKEGRKKRDKKGEGGIKLYTYVCRSRKLLDMSCWLNEIIEQRIVKHLGVTDHTVIILDQRNY